MYTSTDKNTKLPKCSEETAAIYIRVSHPRQVTNYSIPTQLEACRKYLDYRKIKEVGVFIEEGESAKTHDRYELQNLLYFLSRNKGKVTYVLVYKIDRWARNQLDHFSIKALLIKYNCKLLSVVETIDESPIGKFVEGIFASISQLDNELKAERTRACLLTKALSGNYPGKAPYGYRNNPTTKTIQVDKKYFKHIKASLIMFANGTSLEDLTTYFKSRNLKTKLNNNKSIDHKVIKKFLSKSMFYAGKYNWGSNSNIQGTYEKMISWEQHLIIQERLRKKKNINIISQQKALSPFWLNFNYEPSKGFLNCANCGHRMRSCFAKGKSGRNYPYYFCKNNQCKIKKKSINKNDLEVIFEKDLSNQLPTSEQLRYFKSFTLNQWRNECLYIQKVKKELFNEIKSYEQNIDLESITDNTDQFQISTELLYNINNFVKKDILLEKLIELESFLQNIESIYSTSDAIVKQKILALLYPNGVLVCQDKIINVRQNTLFVLSRMSVNPNVIVTMKEV